MRALGHALSGRKVVEDVDILPLGPLRRSLTTFLTPVRMQSTTRTAPALISLTLSTVQPGSNNFTIPAVQYSQREIAAPAAQP
jgi:hypothetical protein